MLSTRLKKSGVVSVLFSRRSPNKMKKPRGREEERNKKKKKGDKRDLLRRRCVHAGGQTRARGCLEAFSSTKRRSISSLLKRSSLTKGRAFEGGFRPHLHNYRVVYDEREREVSRVQGTEDERKFFGSVARLCMTKRRSEVSSGTVLIGGVYIHETRTEERKASISDSDEFHLSLPLSC